MKLSFPRAPQLKHPNPPIPVLPSKKNSRVLAMKMVEPQFLQVKALRSFSCSLEVMILFQFGCRSHTGILKTYRARYHLMVKPMANQYTGDLKHQSYRKPANRPRQKYVMGLCKVWIVRTSPLALIPAERMISWLLSSSWLQWWWSLWTGIPW